MDYTHPESMHGPIQVSDHGVVVRVPDSLNSLQVIAVVDGELAINPLAGPYDGTVFGFFMNEVLGDGNCEVVGIATFEHTPEGHMYELTPGSDRQPTTG